MCLSSNLSMQRALYEHKKISLQLTEEFKELRSALHDNPSTIDPQTIDALLEQLSNSNALIETQKKQALEEGSCLSFIKQTDKLTIILAGLTTMGLLAWVVAGISIQLFRDPEERDPWYEITLDTGGKLIAGLLNGVIILYLVETDGDRNEKRMYFKIAELKDQGVKNTQEVMKTLAEVQNSIKRGEDPTNELAHCLQCREALPPKGFENEVPDTNLLASGMFKLLPEENPLQQRLCKIRDASLEPFVEDDENSQDAPVDENPTIHRSATPELTAPSESDSYPSPIASPQLLAPSDDGSQEAPNHFEGESLTRPPLNGRTKHLPQDTKSLRDTSARINRYHRKWKKLETMLGVPLDQFDLKGRTFYKNPPANHHANAMNDFRVVIEY